MGNSQSPLVCRGFPAQPIMWDNEVHCESVVCSSFTSHTHNTTLLNTQPFSRISSGLDRWLAPWPAEVIAFRCRLFKVSSQHHPLETITDSRRVNYRVFGINSQATEMNRFKDLPLELRRKIWKVASFIPRIVDVWRTPINSRGVAGNRYWDNTSLSYRNHRMVSRSPIPAILHVCHESRKEALRYYILGFDTRKGLRFGELVVGTKPQIYINSEVDTICLPRSEDFRFNIASNTMHDDVSTRDRDFIRALHDLKVRRLAINLSPELCCFSLMIPLSLHTIPKTGVLEELILFSYDPHDLSLPECKEYERHNRRSFEDVHLRELAPEKHRSILIADHQIIERYIDDGFPDHVTSTGSFADSSLPKIRLCSLEGWRFRLRQDCTSCSEPRGEPICGVWRRKRANW